MPPKKSDLGARSRDARRKRVKRAQQLAEQIKLYGSPTRNINMASEEGKRKRQGSEELQEQDSTDNFVESKKKALKIVPYQQDKIKEDETDYKHEIVAQEENTTRKQNKRNLRYEAKNIHTNTNSQADKSSKTVVKCEDMNDSQIAGTSTRDPLYIPPTHAGLSSNKSESSESLTDFVLDIENYENNLCEYTYASYEQNSTAHKEFQRMFFENDFGHVCDICDLLHFKNDLKIVQNKDTSPNIELIRKLLTNVNVEQVKLCPMCFDTCNRNRVPTLSVYNGFKYHPIPENLKNNPLDLLTERLVTPTVPFSQIRRLRHTNGQYGTYGQVINVPLQVNTFVPSLPRNMDDDHCVNININKKNIYKSSYASDVINKKKIKAWLQYLTNTPLYNLYGIKVDESFLNDQDDEKYIIIDSENDSAVSELIRAGEGLMAMQQTLLWKDETCFGIEPMHENDPNRLLDPVDPFEEEFCFPQIYLGLVRTFRDNLDVPPFWIIKSEIRRSDRRGVTPQHLLYMAKKLMWLRLQDALSIPNKFVAKNIIVTKEILESNTLARDSIELNLANLRNLPNSVYYWVERKDDLFAMIRQYGKPTVFFTIKANEVGWPSLLQLLYKLKNNREISVEEAEALHFIDKCRLVNEDAVTCAIYFHKLIDVLMKILQSKNNNPFKKYRVLHYCKRIGFHRGSPRAYVLAWLDNAPDDAFGKDYDQAVDLIDALISVSAEEAGDNIKLQTHKLYCTTRGDTTSKKMRECRFQAPFMPMKKTMILTPFENYDRRFNYKERYNDIRQKLKTYQYEDFQTFYEHNKIHSDEHYINIIRAVIHTTKVFPKRHPREVWHNAFNPFILSIVKSKTDFQFIPDEHSCAPFVAECVNKTNRRVSKLRREIIEIIKERPEIDIFEIGKHVGADLLNYTEMTSQEAAWYLLGLPMSECSRNVVYIPTVWPVNRQTKENNQREWYKLYDKHTHMSNENWFADYEERPANLERVSLAQFVSYYHKNTKGEYIKLDEPRIIRYRNYNKDTFLKEYKREMVTLHIPFRNEAVDILQKKKFLPTYNHNVKLIWQNKKEFESNIDMEKLLKRFKELSKDPGDFHNSEDEMTDNEINLAKEMKTEPINENYHELCNVASTSIENPRSNLNSDIKTEDSETNHEYEVEGVLKMEIDIECEGVQYTNDRGKESVVDDNKFQVTRGVQTDITYINAVYIEAKEDTEESINVETDPLDE